MCHSFVTRDWEKVRSILWIDVPVPISSSPAVNRDRPISVTGAIRSVTTSSEVSAGLYAQTAGRTNY